MPASTTWPEILNRLLANEDLTAPEASWAMDEVMSGMASPAQLASFLTALRAKGESVSEMLGLADSMLEHAHRLEVSGAALDIVGTGGDRAHTVNISTMSAIVAAGAGQPVVKHGNRAASSSSGSADMLEALGVTLDLEPARVQTVLEEVGLTFCFALTFHPSMRHAATVRREMGIPTAFNFLGPLTNPAQPAYAAVGVADHRMAPLMAGVFARRGRDAVVFRGNDGLDEVTPATTTSVWWVHGGEVAELTLDPGRVGVGPHSVGSLRGGDAAHNAQVATDLVAGDQGPVRDAVLLNAGLALGLVDAGESAKEVRTDRDLDELLVHGMNRAAASIDDGAARRLLDHWIEVTAQR